MSDFDAARPSLSPPWTVVIADDTDEIRHLVRRMLTRDGRFTILAEARDGAEAVAYSTRFSPHLVLLDLMMPKLCGTKALEAIKAFSESIRVVVFSGLEDPGPLPLADGFVCKGAPPGAVIASLEAALIA